MAILSPGDPIFAQVLKGEYQSPFPSQDALLDLKFAALLKGIDPGSGETLAAQVLSRAQAVAWQQALGLANKTKATLLGDIPSAWLPKLAFASKEQSALGGGLAVMQGLWAEVAFPESTDPTRLALAVAQVGLDVALDFVGAVPLVGGLMKFIVNLGDMLARLFGSQIPAPVKKLLLPWGTYSQDTDEDLVKTMIHQGYGKVNWTGMFLPPFDTSVPWSLVIGVKDKQELGMMWVPWKGGLATSTEGLGCMPGTFRVAGYVQAPFVPQEQDARLLRYFSDATLMRWGRVLTDQGEFFPATAQTGVLAWQQAQKPGSPDMYKLDCAALEAAWTAYFDQFFDSLWRQYRDNDEWIGEFAAPYLAVRAGKLRLGWRDPENLAATEIHRPHPAPLITPEIFKNGPGSPATRNACLYFESKKGPAGDYPPGSFSTGGSLAYKYETVDGRITRSGGPAWPPGKPLPKGQRCVPWPTPQELLVRYERPDTAFILPAVRRLQVLQARCLQSTLVSAYVRPVAVAGLPAYAAFAASPSLRDECLAIRQKLLTHQARYLVDLRDVKDIDPAFEQQLRAAGVTNSPMQRQQQLNRFATEPLTPQADQPLPAPLGPAEGTLPFASRPARQGRTNHPRLIAAATVGLTTAAAAGYIWSRRHHVST